jgi:hypothetical protein
MCAYSIRSSLAHKPPTLVLTVFRDTSEIAIAIREKTHRKQMDRHGVEAHPAFCRRIGFIREDGVCPHAPQWVKKQRTAHIIKDADRARISDDAMCIRCRTPLAAVTYLAPYCVDCEKKTEGEEEKWYKLMTAAKILKAEREKAGCRPMDAMPSEGKSKAALHSHATETGSRWGHSTAVQCQLAEKEKQSRRDAALRKTKRDAESERLSRLRVDRNQKNISACPGYLNTQINEGDGVGGKEDK